MNGLSESLLELIRRTSAEIPDYVQQVILASLEREKQGFIAEATLKDKATISRIVDVMEREGLVARQPDPEDSRGRRVHATRKAHELRSAALPHARELVARIEEGIPERDLEVTRRTLLRLEENLRALEEKLLAFEHVLEPETPAAVRGRRRTAKK